jgi:hypothetical protein
MGESISCKTSRDVCHRILLASCVRIVEKDHISQVAQNRRNEKVPRVHGQSMIISRKKYKMSELVEEKWSCGCVAGEEDKLC